MPTIGTAVLQVIPSLVGVTEAIQKQVQGQVLDVKVAPFVDKAAAQKAAKEVKDTVETDVKVTPKVDKPAVQQAAKEVKETVEKTATPEVKPKVDQKAAEEAGKKTGEAVAKGAEGSSSAVGQLIIGALEGAGGEAGFRLGEVLAKQIPEGLTGAAGRIGTALKNSLPDSGRVAGMMLGSAIGIGLTDALGKERLDKAGAAVMNGLRKAVGVANNATTIGVSIGNSIATGLNSASGVVAGAADTITNTIGGITVGVEGAKQLLGEDSWAAPGLDTLNQGLEKATPLLNAVTGAATVASAGAQAISVATGLASKAQLIWNAALIANPIGLVVAAIAAIVAGLVLFFTKTEIGRRIWAGFTEYLKVAWEGIKIAFSAAWDVISGIFTGMVEGAKLVWSGIKAEFTMVIDFFKGLGSVIGSAASGMWDGISNAFQAMIEKLKGWWNGFASALSFTSPEWLPGDPVSFSLPKFSGGGFTGEGAKDKPMGVVHAGEYVIKSDSTAKIQNAMPGLLDYLNGKGALPGYAGGGLVAGSEELRKVIGEKFGISNIGGYRPADKYGEHSTGRALDVMTSSKATGDSVKDFAVQNASAIDLKWAIWQQKIWYPDGSSKVMPDRGSPTQNHMDHVHIFSGEGISQGLRGSLAGKEGEQSAVGVMPGGDPTATDQTGAAASSSASQSMSVPGSLSGMAGMWGSQLGAGVGETKSGSDLSLLGSAAGTAVTGQVSSALGAFGVGDSPGWLKGISTLASGISVGGGGGGGASPLPDVNPVSASVPVGAATSAVGGALSGVHGAGAGAAPGPVTNYNIQTTDIEPAYLASQRNDKERAAANLGRY